MSTTFQRRLALLEQQQAPTMRERLVWWEEGQPEPKGAPGERLIIIRWLRPDEEVSGAGASARNEHVVRFHVTIFNGSNALLVVDKLAGKILFGPESNGKDMEAAGFIPPSLFTLQPGLLPHQNSTICIQQSVAKSAAEKIISALDGDGAVAFFFEKLELFARDKDPRMGDVALRLWDGISLSVRKDIPHMKRIIRFTRMAKAY